MSASKIPVITEPQKKLNGESNKTTDSNRSANSNHIRFATPPVPTKRTNNLKQTDRLFPAPNSPQAIGSKSRLSKREKVHLAPHHSALDWERVKHEKNVKNIDPSSFPVRITKKELAQHKLPGDYWVALNGKIYNITEYLDYHPGGAEILARNAGRDIMPLFMKYHRWVSYERILDECFIGFLI